MVRNQSLGNNHGWNFTEPPTRDFFWIGGQGEWGDVNNWSFESGGSPADCIPVAYDNVYFDANSGFSPGNRTVQINAHAFCNDMIWDDAPGNPLLLGTEGHSMNIFGSLQLQSNMEVQINQWLFSWNFRSTESGNTIALNGQVLNASSQGVHFNGNGGGWTLIDEFSTIGSIVFTEGSLFTNGNTVNTTNIQIVTQFLKHLSLSNSVINIQHGFGISGSNINLDAGTSVINIVEGGGRFYVGPNPDLRFHNVHFLSPTLSQSTLTGNNTTFNTVTFAGNGAIQNNNTFDTLMLAPGGKHLIQSGTTQTIVSLFSAKGNPCFFININSTNPTYPATISMAAPDTVVVDFIRLKDIYATGGALFIGAKNATNLGNNVGWDFTIAPGSYIFGFGPDLPLNCDEFPYILNTENFNPNPGTTFLWDDGSTDSEMLINDFGIFSVKVSYADFCSIQDTIEIISPPFPTVDLGTEIYLPRGNVISLDAGPGEEYNYLWSTEETTQTIEISEYGIYEVEVTNKHHCVANDEVIVYSEPLVITAEPFDVEIFSATLGGDVLSDGGAEVTERGILFGTNPDPQNYGIKTEIGNGLGQFSKKFEDLQPNNTTYYLVAYAINKGDTAYGEVKSFSTDILIPDVFIPNAFMPSSHLIENQIFLPVFSHPPIGFSMKIINRWGEEIFFSEDYQYGWNGRVNNNDAPHGTYAYRISYHFENGINDEAFGVFILVR